MMLQGAHKRMQGRSSGACKGRVPYGQTAMAVAGFSCLQLGKQYASRSREWSPLFSWSRRLQSCWYHLRNARDLSFDSRSVWLSEDYTIEGAIDRV